MNLTHATLFHRMIHESKLELMLDHLKLLESKENVPLITPSMRFDGMINLPYKGSKEVRDGF